MRRSLTAFAVVACLAASTVSAEPAPARLLKVATLHTSDPTLTGANAMVWDGDGRILAVGRAPALRDEYPDAEVLDLGQVVVIPGLIDAHAHLMNLGRALLSADLAGARSKDEVIERLQADARGLPDGAWLRGRGWDQNLWPEQAFPTAADLDAAFPDRPVWLDRVDGHAGWANSAALRAAAARDGARDLRGDWHPDGGRIVREGGEPTGVFIDAAMALVESAIPPGSGASDEQALERALAVAVRSGLTGVHDMGVSREELALFRRFADAGRLPLRISAYADGDGDALDDLCGGGLYRHPQGRLRMEGVKLYMDGALGSRGAALIADYSDEPGNDGLLLTEPAALATAVRKARDCGVQVATHAIGDRGNRLVLDSYKDALAGDTGRDRRWRIEHAQVVAPDDIPRFAALGLIASMQPTHATSDMPWAEDRVGPERLAGAYAWRRFLDAGVPLALGSDFPVESVDPRLGLYAAVTRQDREGRPPGGWLADQKLEIAEALHGFTAAAAHAGRAEDTVGRLAPGLRADFVVLADDPFALPSAQLDEVQVLSTWVDGVPVFEAE